MLGVEVCKKILGNNNDEEVRLIRDFLYKMAKLQIEAEETNNKNLKNENHECDNILSSKLG